MKKIFKHIQIPLAIALFFFAAGLVLAAECGDMVKCAVCGKEMKKADAKITYVYKEKTYYFASEKCKEAFVKEPEKFLQAKCCMKDMVCCPVCGEKMKKADAKITSVYKEKTYYFASEKCKEAFVKEPEKFLQAKCCMKDMVCCPGCGKGMKKGDAKIAYEYKGQTYNFCCEKCKEAFVKEPEKFLKTVFTCPMHPEATADKPGKCPKCGMNMEKKTMVCCKMMGGCCHMKMKGCGAKNEEGKMKDCGKKKECEKACASKAKSAADTKKKEEK